MTETPPAPTSESAEVKLIQYFRRNGYVRVVNPKRREELGQKYKKGYEVRLVAYTENELEEMRELLSQVGFRPGKQFPKHHQFVLPIYGRKAVEWFQKRAR